jgi:hypothetical protein
VIIDIIINRNLLAEPGVYPDVGSHWRAASRDRRFSASRGISAFLVLLHFVSCGAGCQQLPTCGGLAIRLLAALHDTSISAG